MAFRQVVVKPTNWAGFRWFQGPDGEARRHNQRQSDQDYWSWLLPNLQPWGNGLLRSNAGRRLERTLHRQPDRRHVAHPLFGVFLEADS